MRRTTMLGKSMKIPRRQFLHLAAGAAGVCLGCGAWRGAFAQANLGGSRRRVEIDGKPVRVVDVHCHCVIAEALPVVAGTPLEQHFRATLNSPLNNPPMEKRIAAMDAAGVDVEAMSINEFWYGADRDLAQRLIDVQNEKLAETCKASNGRLVGFASVALQFPDLAAAQLDHAMKNLGLVGGAIGPTVEGEELSSARFDPFWAKCEELDALLFMHPQDSAVSTGVDKRVRGKGYLENTIGNPLETTIALSHLIFEGTFDRFPKLRLCAAHGGGYLASYADRSDAVCVTFPPRCKDVSLKKKPTDYLKQIYVDSIVFTPEALRHLVATVGAGQVMVGTDFGFPWEKDPVGLVLTTPDLSSADKIAILGGTASKLLRLPG
jgi:aminocarboxymuconate-semialdehyde decarboxylase